MLNGKPSRMSSRGRSSSGLSSVAGWELTWEIKISVREGVGGGSTVVGSLGMCFFRGNRTPLMPSQIKYTDMVSYKHRLLGLS